MATTKTRERSATRRQQKADPEPQDVQGPTEGQDQETQETETELPLAVASLGAYKITYHLPTVTLPDGTVIKMLGKWGTEDPKKAAAWLRKTAAEHGVRVEL